MSPLPSKHQTPLHQGLISKLHQAKLLGSLLMGSPSPRHTLGPQDVPPREDLEVRDRGPGDGDIPKALVLCFG